MKEGLFDGAGEVGTAEAVGLEEVEGTEEGSADAVGLVEIEGVEDGTELGDAHVNSCCSMDTSLQGLPRESLTQQRQFTTGSTPRQSAMILTEPSRLTTSHKSHGKSPVKELFLRSNVLMLMETKSGNGSSNLSNALCDKSTKAAGMNIEWRVRYIVFVITYQECTKQVIHTKLLHSKDVTWDHLREPFINSSFNNELGTSQGVIKIHNTSSIRETTEKALSIFFRPTLTSIVNDIKQCCSAVIL